MPNFACLWPTRVPTPLVKAFAFLGRSMGLRASPSHGIDTRVLCWWAATPAAALLGVLYWRSCLPLHHAYPLILYSATALVNVSAARPAARPARPARLPPPEPRHNPFPQWLHALPDTRPGLRTGATQHELPCQIPSQIPSQIKFHPGLHTGAAQQERPGWLALCTHGASLV